MLHDVLIVGVMAAMTFLTRLFPFLFFGGKKTPPRIVKYLGEFLPPAVMAILILYCLKEVRFDTLSGFLPAFLSSAAVVLLHLWRRNILLSIGAGTVLYMVLIRII